MIKNITNDSKSLPSIEYIKSLEKEWGITIPVELLDFFIKINGGAPELNTYKNENNETYILHEFLYVGSREKEGSFEDVVKYLIIEMEVMPKYLIPFANDEGGDFYCISTKKESYGKVYFFWSEFCDDLDRAIEYVAPSFGDFLNKMQEQESTPVALDWEISFIYKKSDDTQRQLFKFLEEKYNLIEGINVISIFKNSEIRVFLVENEDEDEEAEFDEVCVSISDQIFHKDTFEDELKKFTDFINCCFENNTNLEYAVCSFLSNSYFLGEVKKLDEFNSDLLKRFPVAYEKKDGFKLPLLYINTEAQDIFV